MRLTRIAARDFFAYEDLDLDLAGMTSVVVVGKNGAGKSALLDAVTWALYDEIGRDITSRDLVIRDGADSAWVAVNFEAAGREVRVEREKQRGRTGTLSLTVDGTPDTRHTIAETKAAIEHLVGLPFGALMAGPVMAQETAAAFMKARPADRKDLLVRLFGLDRYETYWRAASDQRKVAQGSLSGIDLLIEQATGRLAGEAGLIAALKYEQDKLAAVTEAQSLAHDRITAAKEGIAAATARAERHDSLKRQQDALVARLSTNEREQAGLKARLAEARVLVDRPLPPIDLEAISQTEAEIERGRSAMAARSRIEYELQVALTQEATRRTARERLAGVPCGGEGIYATCQFLVNAPTEADVAAAAAAVAELRDQLAHTTSEDVQPLRDRLLVMRSRMENRRTEEVRQAGAVATLDEGSRNATALRETHSATTAELDRVRAELAEVDTAGRALAGLREELAAAESTYAQARTLATQHYSNVKRHEADLATIAQTKEDLAGWRAKRAETDALVASLDLLAQAFHRDGIPTRILMGGIPLIESEANRILATLPGDLSIALRTERVKATGGMADTLDVIVTVNGWEREYGLLSVGMRFRVDLALRLGLARVLTHRTGATIDTVWLDEPLAALDVEGREAVMETLGQLEQDFGLIVVVSHHPDFNDRFGARIDVEQTDGVSTARLAA